MKSWSIKLIGAGAACMGLTLCTGIAHGQGRTILDFQVSTDGQNWRDQVTVGGTTPVTVQVRAAVSYVGTGSSQRPLGLASINFQPTLTNWNASRDHVRSFAASGENFNGGAVLDIPGPNTLYGRIMPFAMTGPGESNPYAVHVQEFGGVASMRLALRSATEWPSPHAIENSNGTDGLACAQRAFGNLTSQDPFFSTQISRVVVFKFAVTLDPSSGPRSMSVGAPESSLSRNWQTGLREAAWYSGLTDTYGRIKSEISVDDAAIQVVPGPCGAALVTIVSVGAALRRRRA
ncbi:MAG: hypothetical protein NTV94_08780 [Planctomycetota bacterium]|nr:hypothetical protein [Planctomycetota bacterium]